MKCKPTPGGHKLDHPTPELLHQQAVKAVRRGQAVTDVAGAISQAGNHVMRHVTLFLIGFLNCWSVPALAAAEAPTAPNGRPRIALVLSGGGARGGAHLGVLRALEEMHVPIDIIVGSSAGAIVGAAYSSGMSVTEIEREMQTLSTASLFHDVGRRDLSVARKRDDSASFVGPEMGIGRDGLSLPKGAVAGVAVEAVIRRLTARQNSPNFSLLPIPFRAVATDVSSGEMVVLERGNLAQAIRASMAIPAAVNPVEIDGRLLVDGSIARNLPVDVARAMGANVIIAVNIGTPLLKREEIKSILSMSEQMMRLLTASNAGASLAQLNPDIDVLITPNLGTIDAGSFDLLKEAESFGLSAGREAASKLQRYAIPAQEYTLLNTSRRSAPAPQGILLSSVHIDGARRVPENALRETMETQPGQPFDAAAAERDMRRLFGRGDFEHVSYSINALADGRHQMVTTVDEKSWGPQYLRLGLGISTDFAGDSFFSLRALHRWTWLNSLGAEWRNDIETGHTDRLSTEWLQPLTAAQRVFASVYLTAERAPLDLYERGERLASLRNQAVTAGIDVGIPIAEWGEARIGISRGHEKIFNASSTFSPELFTRPRTAGIHARLHVDTLDNKQFPRSGVEADMRVYSSRTSLGADSNYNKLTFSTLGAIAHGPHSLHAAMEVHRTLGGGELPIQELVPFGGFLRMSGYRTGELLGESLYFGRVVYNYQISRPGLLNGVYLGLSSELGRMRNTIDVEEGKQTVRSNALYIAIDTPLGPLYFGSGRASRNKSSIYLLLGKP